MKDEVTKEVAKMLVKTVVGGVISCGCLDFLNGLDKSEPTVRKELFKVTTSVGAGLVGEEILSTSAKGWYLLIKSLSN